MPQASFPPQPGSLPHYHSGRASPERYDNRYEQGFSESFVTILGKHSFAPIRSALLGGAIVQSVGIIGVLRMPGYESPTLYIRNPVAWDRGYQELRRIPIPRTPVNKRSAKAQDPVRD